MSKAEELIACLEGEIAKRDARIAGLEQQVIGMQQLGRLAMRTGVYSMDRLELLHRKP